MKKLLIIGDPKGTHSITALNTYSPENIWVWENDSRHIYTINQIHDRINVITDLDEVKDMKFDVVIGNPPYQDSSNVDKATNLWTHFWKRCLELAKDNGIVSLITPITWCSPSRDFKSPKYGYKGDVRLWDTFNRYTSVADIDTITDQFKGVGSTFGRVTVYKSGHEGLSFIGGYDTSLGFLPVSGDINEVFSRIDLVDNLGKHFRMDDQYRNELKVSIPVTRGFIDKPDMIQICQPHEHGTSASDEPRFYRYIYVKDMNEAQMVKDIIMDHADILCKHCRWVGYMNLRMVELIKYVPVG